MDAITAKPEPLKLMRYITLDSAQAGGMMCGCLKNIVNH
jgi:hypothetical protein